MWTLADPEVQRALRLGKTRRQQAAMLGVSEKTVYRLQSQAHTPYRGVASPCDVALTGYGDEVTAGDIVIREVKYRNDVYTVEQPLVSEDGFRLRVVHSETGRRTVLRNLQHVRLL